MAILSWLHMELVPLNCLLLVLPIGWGRCLQGAICWPTISRRLVISRRGMPVSCVRCFPGLCVSGTYLTGAFVAGRVLLTDMYFVDVKYAYSFSRHAFRRPRVLSRAFGCGASKGAVGTLRRMSGSRPSTVSVLGASNVSELALKNKGLLSASPSRVGDMENPTFLLFFRK